MTLPVAFHRAARADFIEAVAWYEAQRPNLGVAFIAEIELCVALAAEQPQLYAVVHKDVRRLTAEHFPYSVYFRAQPQRVVIPAVFHGRRNPAIWQRRA